MDKREARRHVRRALAEHARRLGQDPGVVGDPDDRALLIEQFNWAAEWLAPGETSVLPANLRPLVRPDGTELEEWRRPGEHPDPDVEPARSAAGG